MRYSASSLLQRLVSGDRGALAYAITLAESQNRRKKDFATALIGNAKDGVEKTSMRIAITGAPGAGKSSLLEKIGLELVNNGSRVAVLAIDPSSPTSKGSLLGDKTRMTQLSCHPNAFIRASPTSGVLGGITRATGDAIVLCEISGYDVIFIETVGVGQSESVVSDVTDCCVMVLSPNNGDELQALKRGVFELCDFFAINKCDGDLVPSANVLKSDILSASKFMAKRRGHWSPVVKCVSAETSYNVKEFMQEVIEFHQNELASGRLLELRKRQKISALKHILEEHVLQHFWTSASDVFSNVQKQLLDNSISVSRASEIILKQYFQN